MMSKKSIYKVITLFVSLLLFYNLSAQPSDWYIPITGGNHTVLVQSTISVTFNGNNIENGDYLGVFYDSAGTLACAGMLQWQGVNDAITIWGDDVQTIEPDGMGTNEVFKWKIYDVSANVEYLATASYQSGFANDSTFTVNGISSLASLTGYILNQNPTFPNWNFPSGGGTGSNHSILVQNTIPITIDGTQIVSGDYIGVFFDSLGVLACGGYVVYDPSGNMFITAWGADLGNDGFAANEEFKWKIWRQSDNTDYDAVSTYQTIGFPNQGNFISNGISGLASLSVVFYSGPDLELSEWTAPLSVCESLTSTEQITIQIINVGNSVINSFDVTFSIDGGTTNFTETVTQTLNIGDTINYTSLQTFDMSLIGTIFNCSASVSEATDLNNINDDVFIDVGNYQTPVVSMSGLQASYCLNDPIDTIVGIPSGGDYSGLGITNGLFFPTNVGQTTIFYTVSNPGCNVSDSMSTEVFDNPTVDLGVQPTPLCDGDNFNVQAPVGYSSYLWSDGSTDNSLNILSDGTYSVTVTNTGGCTSIDDIVVSFTPLPTPNFPVEMDDCEGATITLDAGIGSVFYWNDAAIPSFSQFLDVDTSGNYWVEVVYMGCSGFDTVEVNFHPNPVAQIVGDIEACEGETATLEVNAADSYSWSTGETTQNISISNTGTYGVTITSIYGCEGSDSHNITFFPIPNFSIVASGLLCDGEIVTLTADIAVPEYIWDNGSTSQSIDVTSSGTYEVTITDNHDCSNTSNIMLELGTAPEANFDIVISGFDVTITNNSVNANSYLWDFGDGNTSTDMNPVHQYALEGVYTITLVAENDCGTDTFTYEVTLTGINSNDIGYSFSINPNPSNGKFIVSFNNMSAENVTVKIHNLIGQEIFSAFYYVENGLLEKQIDLQDISKGIYLVKLITKEGISSKQLIIN